ncbi:hypothetical protein N431DRAFT_488164 [Stipitochalara longipes BDJ]|nr:hypothetical protein N431DRAFT_488164 [Stipitochalara longipes BDJ]
MAWKCPDRACGHVASPGTSGCRCKKHKSRNGSRKTNCCKCKKRMSHVDFANIYNSPTTPVEADYETGKSSGNSISPTHY